LLVGWTLPGVALLLFGVAALLGSVAAFLAGWTLVGVAFLLLGVAALLAGVALLYRPELPRRLVVWLTKRDDLQLRPNGDEGRERPS
jgi:membrane protein implicated in regulation of membrane protease activity